MSSGSWRAALSQTLTGLRKGTSPAAARAAAWVFFGQVGTMTASLAGVRLLTANMTPANYGELALWLTVASLAAGLVQSPLSQAQLRMYSTAREAGALGAYWTAARRLGIYSAGVTVLICAGAVLLAPLFGAARNVPAAIATCVFSIASGEFGRRTSVTIAAQRRPLAAAAQAGHEWLRIILAVTVVRLVAPVPTSALLAFGTSACLWSLIQSRITHRAEPALRQHGSAAADGEWRGKLLTYAWPFAAWGVAAVLQANVDRWVAGARGGAVDAGLIAIIAQLGVAPITAIAAAVSQFVSPILFARVGDGRDPARAAAARRLVTLLVVGTLAGTALGVGLAVLLRDVVFGLLVGKAYAGAAVLWPLGLAIGGVFAAMQFACLLPMALNRPATLLPVKIAHAVFAVSGSVLGAQLGGLHGVLWGALASNSIAAAWTFLIAWRVGAQAAPASTGGPETLSSPRAP